MRARTRTLLASPWFITLVAFAFRLGNVFVHKLYQIPSNLDHVYFGYEMGRLARSIVLGRGYGSVFDANSGPTAWWGPVYPYLLAGIFKVFGIYTSASAIAILSLNSLFSALTCMAIFLIADETFGRKISIVTAWVWALLPYAIYWPTHHVWETSFSAFLLSFAILVSLRMQGSSRISHWLGLGSLWALIALTNATLLSFLPVALVWMCHGIGRKHLTFGRPLLAFVAIFILGVSPWVVRNYRVFHSFMFPRSNLGLELYVENHEGGNTKCVVTCSPLWNERERDKYDQMGESAYMNERGKIAFRFLWQHPKQFFFRSLRRVLFFWITEPEEFWIMRTHRWLRQGIFLTFTLLDLAGLWLAIRNRVRGTFLFAGLLITYPLIYYITHTESRYSHPLAPMSLMLAAYLLCQIVFRARSRSEETTEEVLVETLTLAKN